MQATQAPTSELLAQSVWRVQPHTYAAHASGGRWKAYQHLAFIGALIFSAVMAGSGRVIINCPPRHGKSELSSFWTPVWFLDAFPDRRVILTSYESGVATDWGRRVRNEFASNANCLTTLRDDSKSASRWNTPEGGGMIATGVGGPISGRGGDLLIIDDPYKNAQQAYSRTYRRHLIDWFNSTLYTRAEPGATIIVLMTRWHEQDLCGHLIEDHADKWDVVRLPAIAEDADPLGRQPGEALCEERYSVGALEKLRRAVGSWVWPALYQQRPAAAGVNRAYRNYTQRNLDPSIGLQRDRPLHFSADFNSNPHMHCEIGQHDDKADRFTTVYELAEPSLRCARDAGRAFCKLIKTLGGWQWPELHLFGDATGGHAGRNTATGESDWRILIQTIKHELPNIVIRRRIPASNPPVADRLNAANEALSDIEGNVHWHIHPRCECLLTDLKNVMTDESGLIDDSDSFLTHATDAEGYRVYRLRPVRSPHKPSKGRFGLRV